jgi:hypothetical protein
MGALDTRGWKWDHSDYSKPALGDSGPWAWWLPLAWRAVADPAGRHPLPKPPTGRYPFGDDGGPKSLAYMIAWWAPLLQLLFFGLGWVRPDLGLARWIELGQPTEDPVLRTVQRWWGPRLLDYLAWAARSELLVQRAVAIGEVTHTSVSRVELPELWADRRRSPEWQQTWGEGDLHLSFHAGSAVAHDDHDLAYPESVLMTDLADAPRAAMILPAYEGWYAALSQLGSHLPDRADRRSWRVDVAIRPLGWLGTYRRSRQTGRWFSGRHRWHQLGQDEPLASASLL